MLSMLITSVTVPSLVTVSLNLAPRSVFIRLSAKVLYSPRTARLRVITSLFACATAPLLAFITSPLLAAALAPSFVASFVITSSLILSFSLSLFSIGKSR